MYGGIGVIDEMDIGFYFKCVCVIEMLLGDFGFYRDVYLVLNVYWWFSWENWIFFGLYLLYCGWIFFGVVFVCFGRGVWSGWKEDWEIVSDFVFYVCGVSNDWG